MLTEVLFPEVANLYGDLENIDFIKRAVPQMEIVNDSLVEEPYFVKNVPDLIYMGSMTESAQLLIIEKLQPYTDRINELINKGVHFLITGNAIEIFGKRIIKEDKSEIPCLGIFNTFAETDMVHRFNSLYLGSCISESVPLDAIGDIVGYKSQFTHSYWEDSCIDDYVFFTKRGPGLNPEIKEEGIRRNNFLGTYIIGPILVLNPYFTKWFLEDIGIKEFSIPFEKEAIEAYKVRLEEYSNPNTGFYY